MYDQFSMTVENYLICEKLFLVEQIHKEMRIKYSTLCFGKEMLMWLKQINFLGQLWRSNLF